MGLLDELKKEAQEVQQRSKVEQDATLAQKQLVEEVLQPKMQQLYKYFKQLKETLEVVNPDLTADYDVTGVGGFTDLRQRDYRLYTDDDPKQVRKFTFLYNFAREGTLEVKHESRVAAQQQREYLWQNSLKFTIRDSGGSGSVFVLEKRVPVSFEFEADPEKAAIRMRVKNVDGLGQTVHLFDADRYTPELMEEIAKSVLQKPNRFSQLTGNALTDTTRLRLREQIEHEKQVRNAEAVVGSAPVTKKKRKVKKKSKESIGERFSRTFLGRK